MTGSTELHVHVNQEAPDTITVQALGSGDALVEMAQQLGWLAASFRIPKPNDLTCSELYLKRVQGWLVSLLSVILHVVHAWASEHVPHIQVPHAALDWNGGQAAFKVIAEHSMLELRKTLDDETPYYLKDLVRRLGNDLISCVDAMSLQTKATRGSMRMGRPRLRGWEFRDILDPPVLRRMKEEKLDTSGCGWELIVEGMLVLVCQGLGDVIQPAEPEMVCRKWSPVPRGMMYLTASVTCLQQLFKRRGKSQGCTKVTDTLLWQPLGHLLFENCAHSRTSQCPKLPQQLVENGK